MQDETKENTIDREAETEVPPPPKRPRGFAALAPEARRAISRQGGLAAHARGTAHRWTSEEAKVIGKLGGAAPHKSRGGKRRAEARA